LPETHSIFTLAYPHLYQEQLMPRTEDRNYGNLFSGNEPLLRRFTEYGIAAIDKSAFTGNERQKLIGKMAEYVCEWDTQERDIYSILSSTFPVLLTAAAGDYHSICQSIEKLDILLEKLQQRNTDAKGCLQHGFPGVSRHPHFSAAAISPLMDFAIELAANGIDPRHAVALGGAACLQIARDDQHLLRKLCEELTKFIVEADSYGVSGLFPILTGIVEIAYAYSEESEGFLCALDDLLELCRTMQVQGIDPYSAVEFGISQAYITSAGTPFLRDQIIPLALSQTQAGYDPTPLLLEGINCLVSLPPDYLPKVIEAIRLANYEKAYTADFTAYTLERLWDLIDLSKLSAESVFDLTREAIKLCKALSPDKFQPLLTFKYGLPNILAEAKLSAKEIRTIFEMARNLARKGIDPGPVLEHGYPYASKALPIGEDSHNNLMQACERLIHLDQSPLRFLQYGIPLLVGGTSPQAIEFAQRLERLTSLYEKLNAINVDADQIVSYGLYGLSKFLAKDEEAIFTTLDGIETLAATLQERGMNPTDSLQKGIPALANTLEKYPQFSGVIFTNAISLAARNIEPSILFNAGLDKLLLSLPEDEKNIRAALPLLVELITRFADRDITPETRFAEMFAEFSVHLKPDLQKLMLLSEQLQKSLSKNIDATTAFTYGLPQLLQMSRSEAEQKQLFAFLQALLLDLQAAALPGYALSRYALGIFFHLSQSQPKQENHIRSIFVRLIERYAGNPEAIAYLCQYGLPLAAIKAASISEFEANLELIEAAKKKQNLAWEMTVRQCQSPVRQFATNSGQMRSLFNACFTLAMRQNSGEQLTEEIFSQILTLLSQVSDDTEIMQHQLRQWQQMVEQAVLGSSIEETLRLLQSILSRVREKQNIWSELLLPTIRAHGQRSTSLLSSYFALVNDIEAQEARTLLREIVTQRGVKSLAIIANLLVAGKHRQCISTIAGESDTLRNFLNNFNYTSPDVYEQYKQIRNSPDLNEEEKAEQLEQLEKRCKGLIEAVITGEISSQELGDSNLAAVLYHVFPPAASVSQNKYTHLIDMAEDHPEHTASLTDGENIWSKKIPMGAYSLRQGVSIDYTPWRNIRALLGITENMAKGEADAQQAEEQNRALLAGLGEELFEKWLSSSLSKEPIKAELLPKLYNYYLSYHGELKYALNDVATLLKYREFLADSLYEIILAALNEFRQRNNERYERQARRKLATAATMGKGLRRSVQKMIRSYQLGQIDQTTVLERLERLLKGFSYSEKTSALLQATEEELGKILLELQPKQHDAALGQESKRILKDLVGQELAAMEKQLYGGSGEISNLVYSYDNFANLDITFQLSKRKLHSPIGYCEGVCTATDMQLWDNPNFLQAIIWGENRQAMGGVHILLGRINDKQCMFLPGINPSLQLLREAGAENIYEAIIEYAQILVEKWQLHGLYIPSQMYIATNRGLIATIIKERGYREIRIANQPFSYSPYRYTIESVFSVSERNAEPSG
jgi:hypothetical protein